MLIFGTAVPALSLLTLTLRHPNALPVSIIAGHALLGSVLSTHRLGIELAMTREQELGVLLAASGVSRRVYLGGVAVYAMGFSVVPIAVISLAAYPLAIVSVEGYAWLAACIAIHGSLIATFLCLGAMLRSTTAVRLATKTLMAVFVGFCPLLYASDRVPELLRPIVDKVPLTVAVDLLAQALSANVPVSGLVYILVVLAGFLGAAFGAFRWHEA